ncbi:ORF15 [Ictalurid herpesvirus 1]|uniref:Protein kinase ORF15 n=1 Tax=Ictalurid herpesvirus 1 (strain Auburn) TaxID=766178 RepID=KR15_ICHVA|nr:ORF15 [Ictalurid herpesvirus 1]Q00097.1 RecName: Full=Protein kinase ORF15 [Ictalurid herpesvirus 1 (strain Auburn)]AAA88118.1 ORF15 [Ictalurid herpesvirus 1]
MAAVNWLKDEPYPEKPTRRNHLSFGPARLPTGDWDWIMTYYKPEAREWLRTMNNPLWSGPEDVLGLLPAGVPVTEKIFVKEVYPGLKGFLQMFIPVKVAGCLLFGFSPLSRTGMATLKTAPVFRGGYAPAAPGIPMQVYAWEMACKIDAAPRLFKWELIVGEYFVRLATLSECSAGGDVGAYIRGGRPISIEAAAVKTRELASTLYLLAQNNVYHGDVKIANTVITEPHGRLGLIDFEMAHPLDMTMSGLREGLEVPIKWDMVCTDEYRAPEGHGPFPDILSAEAQLVWQVGLFMLDVIGIEIIENRNQGLWEQPDFPGLAAREVGIGRSLLACEHRAFLDYLTIARGCLRTNPRERPRLTLLIAQLTKFIREVATQPEH